MFTVAIGEYNILCMSQGLPRMYAEYVAHARLADEVGHDVDEVGHGVDEVGHDKANGETCFVAVSKGADWPFLVVSQVYEPGQSAGFTPGALLALETGILFIGAGERLLAYRLENPRRLWEDTADIGFWGWARHEDVVLMSAELELAAWDIDGKKLWSTFVEPPWTYKVVSGAVQLDVMGNKSSFSLRGGPP